MGKELMRVAATVEYVRMTDTAEKTRCYMHLAFHASADRQFNTITIDVSEEEFQMMRARVGKPVMLSVEDA